MFALVPYCNLKLTGISCVELHPYFTTDYFLQVLIPKGRYSGQKLTKLVKAKIPDRAKSTKAIVPVIILVKYNITTNKAIKTRTIRSVEPMFFFITQNFL